MYNGEPSTFLTDNIKQIAWPTNAMGYGVENKIRNRLLHKFSLRTKASRCLYLSLVLTTTTSPLVLERTPPIHSLFTSDKLQIANNHITVLPKRVRKLPYRSFPYISLLVIAAVYLYNFPSNSKFVF